MISKKIAVISGCNSGIGKATAIELCRMDYHVIMLVRDSDKSRAALEEIKRATKSEDIDMLYVDLSSQESIRAVAKKLESAYPQLDLLINNAGVFKRSFVLTRDEIEYTLAVNYLAPFLLTNLLLPLIEKSPQARIVNVTSALYKRGRINFDTLSLNEGFSGDKAYANSKLLVVHFTRILSERLASKNITVNCVHPGVIATEVFREYPEWFKSILNVLIAKPEEGAKPVVYLATSPDVESITGEYFNKTKMKKVAPLVENSGILEQIWEFSEALTHLA